MNELKVLPCPHCGNKNIVTWSWLSPYHTDAKWKHNGKYENSWDHNKMYADITCKDCNFGSSNGEFSEIAVKENDKQTWKEARKIAGTKAEEKAIVAWNRRTQPKNKQLTLYDTIRSMSVEKMATFLSMGWHHVEYEDGDYDPEIMEMLKQPYAHKPEQEEKQNG